MTILELNNAFMADSVRFWNKAARKYAASAIADPLGYERSLRRVLGILMPTDQVLELGCGTGTSALRLAPATAHFLATDISPAMVEIARNKLVGAPQGVHGMLHFQVADANASLSAPAAPGWDVVLAFNLLHLVPDIDASLAQVVRHLRPGGRFISKTPCIAHMNRLVPYVALPIMRALGLAPPVKVLTQDELIAAIQRSGLIIECVEHHASSGAKRDWRPFVIAIKANA
jgi:SAM-dependent methyltransferase